MLIVGNRALVRILPQVYREKKEPIHQHIAGIINQLPSCDTAEVNSILQVAALVSKESPQVRLKNFYFIIKFEKLYRLANDISLNMEE